MNADRVDRVLRSHEMFFHATVLTEPVADLWGQVRVPSMPRPDHASADIAELRHCGNRATYVVVGDVAEDAAEQDLVRRHSAGVRTRDARIRTADLDGGQAEAIDLLGGTLRVPRVGLQERPGHPLRIRPTLQDSEKVASIAGA